MTKRERIARAAVELDALAGEFALLVADLTDLHDVRVVVEAQAAAHRAARAARELVGV